MRILEYRYAHANTDGVTGYFACEPAFDAPWPDSLTMLEQRPDDQWLWEHALRQFGCLDANARHNFIRLCQSAIADESVQSPQNPRAFILKKFLEQCERHGLRPDADSQDNTESGQTARLCQIANSSIHDHVMEKFDWTSMELPHEKIEVASEPLGTGRPSGLRQWQNPKENASLKELAAIALERLARADLLEGGEMRHEASLSPIALLRQWRLKSSMLAGSSPWKLAGTATAYGRGLSLARARVSCLMEIVERASAHANISENGEFFWQPQLGVLQKRVPDFPPCQPSGRRKAQKEIPQYCVPARSASGKVCLVPAKDVFLFLNLPEEATAAPAGSTGLAAGCDETGARLAALVEVMERHAHAVMPHNPERCFTPASRDELLQALLDDYRARGIHVFFEDITCENRLPAYRCFVTARNGRIAQATAANLNGRDAALSALGETPWPYAYSRPGAFGEASARPASPPPARYLEDLPDYSSGSPENDLDMLEKTFAGMEPVYVDLTRTDLGFSVTRCIVMNYDINCDFDLRNPPGPELIARMREMDLRKHLWQS